jgi:hypothetical protein
MANKTRSTPKATGATKIDRALSKPAISPEELYNLKILPSGRNSIYEALHKGEIECFRIGKKIVIPTAPLRRKLGMEAA